MRERKTLNKALLRRLARKLRRLRHEEHYQQKAFAERTACGTAACIAGHAVVAAGWRLRPSTLYTSAYCVKGRERREIDEQAAIVLEVTL